MDEEHTRGTIMSFFLQVIVFICLFVHISYYVLNVCIFVFFGFESTLLARLLQQEGAQMEAQ